MKTLLLVTMMLTYASFIHVARFFFRAAGGVARGMQFITLVGGTNIVGSMYLVWIGEEPSGWAPYVGAVLFVLSFGLLWSAVRANRARPLTLAYSSDQPEHLVTSGPYRHLRHPFYASYMLAWIAACLATGSLVLIASSSVLFGLYWQAARLEEEKFLKSDLASAYRTYRRRTGMFTPRFLSR